MMESLLQARLTQRPPNNISIQLQDSTPLL